MGKQSIPWAVGLTGLLYFGMLGYWEYEAFETALGFGGNVSQNAQDGAIFGFGLGVAYVAYMILCFTKRHARGYERYSNYRTLWKDARMVSFPLCRSMVL